MPYLRRWWRVRRSIFLCFFLRIRLRRFLISEPIRAATLQGAEPLHTGPVRTSRIDRGVHSTLTGEHGGECTRRVT